jgi:Tfp pilus assembly protein PilF
VIDPPSAGIFIDTLIWEMTIVKTWAMTGAILGLCSGLLLPLVNTTTAQANSAATAKQIAKATFPTIETIQQSPNPLALGQEYLQKGWADAAIIAFETAIKADPRSAAAHLGLAQAQEKNGKLESAWQAYQQVIQLESTNLIALRAIGNLGEYRPEWQNTGIAALTALLKQTPNDTAARTQRALLLGFQGQFEPAWADYSQLDPAAMSVKTLLKAGETAGFSGRSAIAVSLYDRALQQTPDDINAQVYRAYFGLKAQQVSATDATQILQQWLTANPDNITPAVADLAGLLPMNPAWQGLYNQIRQQYPQQLNIQQRSLQLLATQDPAAAKAQAIALVQANPNAPFAYFIQADIARQLKDLPLAAQAYETLLQQQPGQIDALMSLGGVRFEQRNYAAAAQHFQQVLQRDQAHLPARQVLADLYASQDQPLQALKLLREVEKMQRAQGVTDRTVRDRIAQLELNTLKRRSFQTEWEGY